MKFRLFLSIALAVATLVSAEAKGPGKIDFKVAKDGTVSMQYAGKQYIQSSTIGLALKDMNFIKPIGAVCKGDQIVVNYGDFEIVLDYKTRDNGSVKLSVASIPDDIEAFVFGPFVSPEAVDCGEFLGAAWQKDGSAVCIQSLNPKTTGECTLLEDGTRRVSEINPRLDSEIELRFHKQPGLDLPAGVAAGKMNGKMVLSCVAYNMTKPHLVTNSLTGMKNVIAEAIPAPEGSIVGAAIALTCASNGNALLEDIGKLEIEEGLPHPLIDGEWAKTSPHSTDLYLVFSSGDMDAQIRMAERAGIHWIYFSDPFKSWGKFEINTNLYPGGKEQFKAVIEKAHQHGINIGFHTLSNFIHTRDPFVTPVPDKDLLAFDPTKITADISAEDTDIHIAEALNYNVKQSLSSVRIGDEIIVFGSFDKDNLCLKGCKRGAYGTKATTHKAGETITHLADYGYGTLFPSAKIQAEMADNIANMINYADVRRMSFDGLEGCKYTGHGEYGSSAYVQEVFDKVGNNLICDASIPSHYRWHAHSYFNWGEPWYDYQRRGGMYNYRAGNLNIFQRNLLPNMLGWYAIFGESGRFEPTLPETMEHILSRTVAFNAGMCIQVQVPENDKLNSYLDMTKLWQEFKFGVDVPQEIRDLMKDERSDWHLEKKDGKWILSEMFVQDYDMGYQDRSTITESGTTGYQSSDEALKYSSHRSNIVIDCSSPSKEIPSVTEPFHCRIRVGTPEDSGQLHKLRFCGGWYSSAPILTFDVTANAGEYLEYYGGKTLYRYDKNYNFIEKIEGVGNELIVNGAKLNGYTVDYDIIGEKEGAKPMQPTLRYIRTRQTFEF